MESIRQWTIRMGRAGLVAAGILAAALMIPRPALASWYIPAGMGHPPTVGAAQACFPQGVHLPYWYYRLSFVNELFCKGPGETGDEAPPSQAGGDNGGDNESGAGGGTGDNAGNAGGGSGGNVGDNDGGSGGNAGNNGGGTGGTSAPALPSGYSWGSSAEVQSVLDSMNALRAQEGLGPLSIDPELTRLERLRVADLVSHGVITHDTPTYGLPYDMERAAGDHWRVMGAENLAANRSAAIAELALEGHPPHRANIVYPGHNLVGIAIVHGPYGVTLGQLFAGN